MLCSDMRTERLSCGSSESADEGIDQSFSESLSLAEKTKNFHDVVHGHIGLPIICSHFINTSQFQRLKGLKQLGLCYYVYPSASNNRFEHCIGTCYLAGTYGEILRKSQPGLNITDEDVKCLYLAGLMHDIGHGPFSHLWEKFMKRMGINEFEHELMSLQILDDIVEDKRYNMKSRLDQENLNENDIVFIKELILGHPLPGNGEFKGRKPCKKFLYEIISNDRTKIDVDKFDYLLRDCKQLGVAAEFDYKRLMHNSRVVGFKDGAHCDIVDETTPTIIVYRKKTESTLLDLFHSRYIMHQRAYQHRVTKVVEEMLMDALEAADPVFEVEGSNGNKYKLTTAWKDAVAFNKLTDTTVFEFIRQWKWGGPQAALLLDRIVDRDLYKFLGCLDIHVPENTQTKLRRHDSKIRFIQMKINFGGKSKERNPINDVWLYEKMRPNRLIRTRARDQPEEKKTIIIFCQTDRADDADKTDTDNEALSNARNLVERWAVENQFELHYE